MQKPAVGQDTESGSPAAEAEASLAGLLHVAPSYMAA
jgi:hypothetical protein